MGNAFHSLAGPGGNKNLGESTLGDVPVCYGTGAAFQVAHFGFCFYLHHLKILAAAYLQFWTGLGVCDNFTSPLL